jgi:hypothetical protein
MRTIQGVCTSTLIAAIAACTLSAGAARAATTTERPGSILIFPKVVTTGTRDTIIQITNTGNMPEDVRCFYLNGQSCFQTDFNIALTRQQPTVWTAETGRRVNPTDSQRGIDPGLIPPLPTNFAGALICVEVDTSDRPLVRNQLKGEATIVDDSGSSTGNSVSKYNAIAVQGVSSGDMDNVLELDDAEYSECPASLLLNFPRDGGPDDVIEALGNGGLCVGGSNANDPCNNNADCDSNNCSTGQSRTLTRLTVLPCNLDLERLVPTQVVLSLTGADETEAVISGGRGFSCWDSFTVDNLIITPPGTPFATLNIRSTVGGPVVGIAEYFRSDSVANTASAAVNLHAQGICSGGANNGRGCNRPADCPSPGTCEATSSATITIPIH